MSVDVDSRKREVREAANWELAMIGVHLLAIIVVLVTAVMKNGWPGLWWQVLGGVWGLTFGIGIARSVLRRQ